MFEIKSFNIKKYSLLNFALVIIGCLWYFLLLSIPVVYIIDDMTGKYKVEYHEIELTNHVIAELGGVSPGVYSSYEDKAIARGSRVGEALYGAPGANVGGVVGQLFYPQLDFLADFVMLVLSSLGPFGVYVFGIIDILYSGHPLNLWYYTFH